MTKEVYGLNGEPIKLDGRKVVFYGSLYYDDGERWEKVEEQIASLRGSIADGAEIVAVFFDVLHKPCQRGAAKKMAKRIKDAFELAGTFPEGVSVGCGVGR